MFGSALSAGVVGKGIEKGLLSVNVHNLRDFATDKHRQVDDRPFGGSPGMVLKPEPVFAAVEHIRAAEETPVYLLSPRGNDSMPGKRRRWPGNRESSSYAVDMRGWTSA